MWKPWGAAFAAAMLLTLGPAYAAEPAGTAEGAMAKGTFALAPDTSWAREIPDSEMEDLRGGYFGFSLSFMWTGFVDNQGTTTTDATDTIVETTGAVDNNVDLSVSLGTDSFNGSSGLISLVNVEGVGNVVESNIYLNLTIITGGTSTTTVQNMISQFGSIGVTQ